MKLDYPWIPPFTRYFIFITNEILCNTDYYLLKCCHIIQLYKIRTHHRNKKWVCLAINKIKKTFSSIKITMVVIWHQRCKNGIWSSGAFKKLSASGWLINEFMNLGNVKCTWSFFRGLIQTYTEASLFALEWFSESSLIRLLQNILHMGPVPISDGASYRKISWSL